MVTNVNHFMKDNHGYWKTCRVCNPDFCFRRLNPSTSRAGGVKLLRVAQTEEPSDLERSLSPLSVKSEP